MLDLTLAFGTLAVTVGTFALCIAHLMLWGAAAERSGSDFLPRLFNAQSSVIFGMFALYGLVGTQCLVASDDPMWCVAYFPASSYRQTSAVVGAAWALMVVFVSSAAAFAVTPPGACVPAPCVLPLPPVFVESIRATLCRLRDAALPVRHRAAGHQRAAHHRAAARRRAHRQQL